MIDRYELWVYWNFFGQWVKVESCDSYDNILEYISDAGLDKREFRYYIRIISNKVVFDTDINQSLNDKE